MSGSSDRWVTGLCYCFCLCFRWQEFWQLIRDVSRVWVVVCEKANYDIRRNTPSLATTSVPISKLDLCTYTHRTLRCVLQLWYCCGVSACLLVCAQERLLSHSRHTCDVVTCYVTKSHEAANTEFASTQSHQQTTQQQKPFWSSIRRNEWARKTTRPFHFHTQNKFTKIYRIYPCFQSKSYRSVKKTKTIVLSF